MTDRHEAQSAVTRLMLAMGRIPPECIDNETEGMIRAHLETVEHSARLLDTLVAELVDLFDWEDTSPMHALNHVRNAVLNQRASLAVAEKIANEYSEALFVARMEIDAIREAAHWHNSRAQVSETPSRIRRHMDKAEALYRAATALEEGQAPKEVAKT